MFLAKVGVCKLKLIINCGLFYFVDVDHNHHQSLQCLRNHMG
jgi:hypothetical protein